MPHSVYLVTTCNNEFCDIIISDDLENKISDMDEWPSFTVNEPQINDWIPNFTDFDILTCETSENRTNDFDKDTFNLSLSSEISCRTMGSTDTGRFFDKPVNMNIMENKPRNLGYTDAKIPLTAEDFEEHFTENPLINDMQAYQISNAEVRNKNLSSNENVTYIFDFCYSHLQYLGYSLIHELLMTL